MDLYVRSFRGAASLAEAFWLVGFITYLVLHVILVYLIGAIRPELKNTIYATSLASGILFPYFIYVFICVWRCGKNSNVFWRILSRIVMIIALLSGIGNLMMLFTGYA